MFLRTWQKHNASAKMAVGIKIDTFKYDKRRCGDNKAKQEEVNNEQIDREMIKGASE